MLFGVIGGSYCLFWEQERRMSTLDRLCSEVASMLNVDSVDADTPLAQIGIDSLNIVELIIMCQQVYPDVLDFEDFAFEEDERILIESRMCSSFADSS